MSASIASKISIKDKLDITYNILNIIVKNNKNLAANKYNDKLLEAQKLIWNGRKLLSPLSPLINP
jgi:hypothetical protein